MLGPVPLFSLVYSSRASSNLRDSSLTALLRNARAHNQQARLSGLLLYGQGQFLQVLEGTEPALSELYARIEADSRHLEVRLLAYGPIAARSFPDWRMGFAVTDENLLARVTGFLPLPAVPGLTAHPSAALSQLLRDFARG